MRSTVRFTELILEITNACYHRCVHCSTFGGTPHENELTQDERLRVLRQACRFGLYMTPQMNADECRQYQVFMRLCFLNMRNYL
jgi:hypothetical protein